MGKLLTIRPSMFVSPQNHMTPVPPNQVFPPSDVAHQWPPLHPLLCCASFISDYVSGLSLDEIVN
ncbi:hypothetical protein GBA52_012630 [Prunus armeniaca]|nr:hypothetical protein GBA52_012630 [Prunus armeniaca]